MIMHEKQHWTLKKCIKRWVFQIYSLPLHQLIDLLEVSRMVNFGGF